MRSIWTRALLAGGGPKHAAIARGIGGAISRGELLPGDRLPTNRELARTLGVTVGTVAKAYRTLSGNGLVRGEVGRGTFVRYRGPDRLEFAIEPAETVRVNLCSNYPVRIEPEAAAIANALALLTERNLIRATVDLTWAAHEPRHRAAATTWFERIGAKALPEGIHVHPGAHPALMTAMLATTRPGDVVLAPSLCYPGVRVLAERFALRVQPIDCDLQGITPRGLDAACRKHAPAAVYCAPTVDTVCATTASSERRQELAHIVQKRDVRLIEFEDTSFLMARPPRPIQHYAPEHVLLIGDTTRALSLGMRTSYLLAPAGLEVRVRDAFHATSWMQIPMLAEVVTLWLEDGTADRLIAARRAELAARHRIVKRLLKRASVQTSPAGHHSWLELPRGQRADAFVAALERLGVGVTGADWFTMPGAKAADAVRLCQGAARSRSDLEWALQVVAEQLRVAPG